MTKENAKIFWKIFAATMLVVAYVWYITAPVPESSPSAPKKPAPITGVAQPTKIPALVPPTLPEAPKPPKEPIMPQPVTIDEMGMPALKPEKKVPMLTMPEIAPKPSPEKKHVDPRIAATVVTSSDGFDRLINGALSIFVFVFTH